MSTTLKNASLGAVTIFSGTSTTSLASAANALSAAQDPTTSAFGPNYKRGRFVFSGTFGAAPSANSAIQLYWRLPADGTLTGTPGAWETDLGRATSPVRSMAATIPLDTTNTAQARASEVVDIPAVPFEVIAVNAATGQTIAAGWSLLLVPLTDVGS